MAPYKAAPLSWPHYINKGLSTHLCYSSSGILHPPPLRLSLQSKLASNWRSSCLSLTSAGTPGVPTCLAFVHHLFTMSFYHFISLWLCLTAQIISHSCTFTIASIDLKNSCIFQFLFAVFLKVGPFACQPTQTFWVSMDWSGARKKGQLVNCLLLKHEELTEFHP